MRAAGWTLRGAATVPNPRTAWTGFRPRHLTPRTCCWGRGGHRQGLGPCTAALARLARHALCLCASGSDCVACTAGHSGDRGTRTPLPDFAASDRTRRCCQSAVLAALGPTFDTPAGVARAAVAEHGLSRCSTHRDRSQHTLTATDRRSPSARVLVPLYEAMSQPHQNSFSVFIWKFYLCTARTLFFGVSDLHYFGSPICGHFFGGPNCFAPDSPLRAVRSHHRTMAPGRQRGRTKDPPDPTPTAPTVGTNPIDASAIVTAMDVLPSGAGGVRRATLQMEKEEQTRKKEEEQKTKDQDTDKENDDENEPAEGAPWLGARPKASPQVRGSREREAAVGGGESVSVGCLGGLGGLGQSARACVRARVRARAACCRR